MSNHTDPEVRAAMTAQHEAIRAHVAGQISVETLHWINHRAFIVFWAYAEREADRQIAAEKATPKKRKRWNWIGGEAA